MANSDTLQLPDSLTLWQCIGCGAMGNAELCEGTCKFQKLDIVGAEQYADLLDKRLSIDEQIESLTVLALALTAHPINWKNAPADYRGLQSQARNLLRTVPNHAADLTGSTEPEDLRMPIWRCVSCGQVEAPQDCLGICIRRMGDFVRAEDYDRLAADFDARRSRAHELASLLRQFAWTSPRAGREEQTSRAFRDKAIALMQSADAMVQGV